LALDQDTRWFHLASFAFLNCLFQIFDLITSPVGAQDSFALAQERVFVIVSNVVKFPVIHSLLWLQHRAQIELSLNNFLLLRLIDIQLLLEVTVEVLSEQLGLIFFAKGNLVRRQLQTIIGVLVEEALEEAEELLPSNSPQSFLREGILSKLISCI